MSEKQRTIVTTAVLSFGIVALVSLLFDSNIRLSPFARWVLRLPETTEQIATLDKNLDFYTEQVAPNEGFTVPLTWGDTGRKLVEAGGIDLASFSKNYTDEEYQNELTYLTETKQDGITITRENAYFWVNTLWALGLTQQSSVLDEGIMGTEYADDVGNFASTGGWTLGRKDAVSLYSSSAIIPLTPEQHELVARVAANVYRPCCNNPTSFPDCNHGMAILGLLELMASQNFSEDDMYRTALAFNAYWFTGTYADLAYYFESKEGTPWQDVDPKRVLGAEFSSATGYQAIKKQVGTIPGTPTQGGSCGA